MTFDLNDQPKIEALDWENLKASDKFRLIAEIADYLGTVNVDDDGITSDKLTRFIEKIPTIPYGYLHELIRALLDDIEIYLGSNSSV